MHYRGSVVVVTGASSGIGYVTARAFARRGATVVAVARREELLRKLIGECAADSPASHHLAADLGERAAAEGVVEETLRRHGRLDVLVNNAAISKHKHLLHCGVEEAERVLRVNFLSCLWTTFAAIPAMLRQGAGCIVNVSSFAGKVVPPREALYGASKAAMNAFTEGLWNDLAGTGIHAGLVIPGPIDTEIWLKEDEPPAYHGPKYPPELVADAIFEVVEKRRREITVPRRNLSLMTARALRLLLPRVLLMGMARMEPTPPELVSAARQRAREGRPLGG